MHISTPRFILAHSGSERKAHDKTPRKAPPSVVIYRLNVGFEVGVVAEQLLTGRVTVDTAGVAGD